MTAETSQLYGFSAALAAAMAAGLVGSFALLKRMTLAADVVSHLALPGIGIALVFRLNPALGAAATLLVGTLVIWGLEKKTGIATEAVIGVVFAASLAAGALVTPKAELEEALFGQLQPLTKMDFFIACGAACLIMGMLLMRRERLILVLFSPELAAASGVKVDRLNLEFLLLFSLTILVCVKFLGALLAGALLMIPAATGQNLASGSKDFLLHSVFASVLSVIAGLFITSRIGGGVSAGPVIVLIATAIFLVVSFFGKE
ncbi:MAG TPA: metal ABC transporter permease [Candidatus Angelobacter sp.]|nr:metal ABC transporter permease [Candidatus Angelobacter sp.]